MSIVAMKRKSRRYKAVVSGRGSEGFSLNGGYRNQGWVGQGVRGRSLGGTRFRGPEAMGSGGVSGTYKRSIVNGGRPCTNDPSIVKRSSSNTPGLISSRMTPRGTVPLGAETLGGKPPIQNIPGTCCTTRPIWVQGDSYNAGANSSQGSRIDKIKRKAATCVTLKSDAGLDRCGQGPGVNEQCKAASYHIGGKKFVRTMYSKNLNPLAVDQSQYMYSGLMAKNSLPTPPCKAPFPPVGKANKWCGETYTDPEEAKAAGLLSTDWGDCKKCDNPGMMYTTSPGTSQRIPVQTPLRDHTIEERARLDGHIVKAIGVTPVPKDGDGDDGITPVACLTDSKQTPPTMTTAGCQSCPISYVGQYKGVGCSKLAKKCDRASDASCNGRCDTYQRVESSADGTCSYQYTFARCNSNETCGLTAGDTSYLVPPNGRITREDYRWSLSVKAIKPPGGELLTKCRANICGSSETDGPCIQRDGSQGSDELVLATSPQYMPPSPDTGPWVPNTSDDPWNPQPAMLLFGIPGALNAPASDRCPTEQRNTPGCWQLVTSVSAPATQPPPTSAWCPYAPVWENQKKLVINCPWSDKDWGAAGAPGEGTGGAAGPDPPKNNDRVLYVCTPKDSTKCPPNGWPWILMFEFMDKDGKLAGYGSIAGAVGGVYTTHFPGGSPGSEISYFNNIMDIMTSCLKNGVAVVVMGQFEYDLFASSDCLWLNKGAATQPDPAYNAMSKSRCWNVGNNPDNAILGRLFHMIKNQTAPFNNQADPKGVARLLDYDKLGLWGYSAGADFASRCIQSFPDGKECPLIDPSSGETVRSEEDPTAQVYPDINWAVLVGGGSYNGYDYPSGESETEAPTEADTPPNFKKCCSNTLGCFPRNYTETRYGVFECVGEAKTCPGDEPQPGRGCCTDCNNASGGNCSRTIGTTKICQPYLSGTTCPDGYDDCCAGESGGPCPWPHDGKNAVVPTTGLKRITEHPPTLLLQFQNDMGAGYQASEWYWNILKGANGMGLTHDEAKVWKAGDDPIRPDQPVWKNAFYLNDEDNPVSQSAPVLITPCVGGDNHGVDCYKDACCQSYSGCTTKQTVCQCPAAVAFMSYYSGVPNANPPTCSGDT